VNGRPGPDAAFVIHELRKAYGATQALGGASFTVRPGEVHALLGENGAGKSTMVRLLSGLARPDSGEIRVGGRVVGLRRPADAHALGIRTAFQELSLIRDLSVAQNILLPEVRRLRWLPPGRVQARAVEAHLERLGLGWLDPDAEVRSLDLPVRQKIEIARALFHGPRVLLLDEPTASLSGGDIDWLGEIIAGVKRAGGAVVFISHRMPEVRRFCDRLTVLRNGRSVGEAAVGEIADDEVVRLIIGRSLDAAFPPRPAGRPAFGEVALAAEGLSAGRLRGADFELRFGEILGVTALQGMGQAELFQACFGALPPRAGRLLVGGQPVRFASPRDAVNHPIGIALVPEERKTEGLFLHMDGRSNTSLPCLSRFARAGVVDEAAERAAVAAVLQRVEAPDRALWTPVGDFSGGNQQKIAIAKWLLTGCRCLLLYDPTRGVDVGTKRQIFDLMRDFVAAGGAVLFYSTEIAELEHLSDRILAIYDGRVTRVLEGPDMHEEAIARAALGEARVAA
jgi:ribose transport system ATP-binding protein